MRRLTATLVVFVLAGAAALAQSPPAPDFSGEWVLDLERTRAANGARAGGGGGGGGMGGTMSSIGGGTPGAAPAETAVKITQTATAITIERISGQVWDKVVYRLDGAESVNVNGRTTNKLRSRWDGARLVSEGASSTELSDGSGSISGTSKELRWIDKDGTMVVETTRTIVATGVQLSSNGKPVTSRQYFRRRAAR